MEFTAKNFDELTTTELYEIFRSRAEVFLLEQNIICQDADRVDYISRHCFLKDDGKVVAYLRAFYVDEAKAAVRIGRVLTLQHGVGLGKRLMEQSIADLKRHMPSKTLCVNSQKHAVGFYEKFGFRTVSGEFLEEGVVHVAMELELS